MDDLSAFVAAVRSCEELPDDVKDSAHHVQGLRRDRFDSSYLDFLDNQVALNARGPEWSQRLAQRRAGLQDYVDAELIDGRLLVGASEYWIKVHGDQPIVVYWEEYSDAQQTT